MRNDIAAKKSSANAPKSTTGARWFKVDESFVTSGLLAQLSGGAIKVYLVLLKYADRSGKAWPGMGTIGKLAGLCNRQGFRAITELEEAGVITRGRGRGRSNLYHTRARADGCSPMTSNMTSMSQPPETSTSGVMRHPVRTTHDMDVAPSRLMDQESMNKMLAGAKGNEPEQQITQPIARSMPALPMGGYRPEPPYIKQSRERRRAETIEHAGAERQRIEQDAKQLADLIASIPPDELAAIKQRVLEKLPAMIRDKLIDKHPADSPMLAGLIAGERQAVLLPSVCA